MGAPPSQPPATNAAPAPAPAPTQPPATNAAPAPAPATNAAPAPAPNQPPANNAAPAPPPANKAPAAPQAVGVADDNAEAFGLLLCGAGESGKTTFTRQLKIKFLGGIKQEDRMNFISTIRGNLVESMQLLLIWLERNDKEINPDLESDAQEISQKNPFNCEFTPELAESLRQLWDDPAVQEAFTHKDETIIPDHMDYFFNKIDELVEDDYTPSDEDVLRARIRSIGIDSVTFYLEGALIRIYDVGGQKNERSKWEKVMNEVGGVIFCVSFAEFDKPMFEEPSVLRIHDALNIFNEITHREQFQSSPIFLICNKFDVFTEKVKNTNSFIKVFPDYTGDPHDPDQCGKYLTDKFIERAAPLSDARPIIPYRQVALDSDQVVNNANAICKYICDNCFDDADEE